MLEMWELIPSPTAAQPHRQTLWLKGQLADVNAVIRRLGSVCGRPRKGSRGKFNFSLYLHPDGPQAIGNIQSALRDITSPGSTAATPPVKPAPAAPAEAPELPAPKPIVQETPSATPAAAAPAPAPQPLFGAALEPNSDYNFEAMVVGSFNRFSHAAANSVVSNPGTMYNPLFLFGNPGTGKTHLLSAIAQALQQPVWLSSGPRLARAVARAAPAGRIGELEELAERSRALLIDDIHLLSVNEHNQDGLVKLLRRFFSASKQVVMSSAYPPRALTAMEQALDFKIASGWAVEMKAFGPEVQREILAMALQRAGFANDEVAVTQVLGHIGEAFFDLGRWLRRLKSLAALRAAAGQAASLHELLPVLFVPELPVPEPLSDEEVQGLLGQMPPAPAGAAQGAVFFPKGRSAHAELMLRRLAAVSKPNGWPFPIRRAALEAYDPDQLFGVPFEIAEACENARAGAALVLGPAPGSGLAGRETELAHAVGHILESLGIRFGWIPFSRVNELAPYFRAGLDLR